MRNRNHYLSLISGITAIALLLTLTLGFFPTSAAAASSSEIRNQIDALKEEREAIREKIAEVKDQYEENENEILDIISRKSVLDQEIQLLYTQIDNISNQLKSYNILIADKQDELDRAQELYAKLNEDNKTRIRTMGEEGDLSYWEVLFHANNFSDLLDRLNMVEEIAISDNKRLDELADAANCVVVAQQNLETEKAEMETAKQELDSAQKELNAKREEADKLFQELLSRGDELAALQEEFEGQEQAFLEQIAQKEAEFDAAKQSEWEDFIPTSVPSTSDGQDGGGTGGSTGGGGWVRPCSYTSITSPFGYRESPTSGASTYHQGVDLDTGTGDPVVAARAGVVTIAGFGTAPGNYIQIDHGDGFRSVYMHLSSIGVSVGQIVSAGQYIGATGKSGIATGDHLHFGISLNGVYVNPCNYIAL